MFWQIMAPNAVVSRLVRLAIHYENFGDFESFKQRFNDAGTKQFGSGWVWLVRTSDGKIDKYAQPRQSDDIGSLSNYGE